VWLYHIKYIKQIEYENKIWFFLHFLRFRAIIVGVLYVIKIFMKKIFMQLWQWILKYKKKLIYGALALFVGQICFFWLWWIGVQNEVFADGQTEATIEWKVTEISDLMKSFQKIIYILVYPFLMIAWKLVDNSLVYWEVFKFDVVLWDLWVMVRNIANFALWFIFIFYIFKYLITQKEDDGPKKLIPKVLIAWVWIQASWFIMAALIDISTILTYSVGWLPITVLWTSAENDTLDHNPYLLNTVLSIDADDIDTYHVYLSDRDKTKFISSCKTFIYSNTGENNQMVEELILSPEMVYYFSGTDECYPTQWDRCHIGDQVYKIAGYTFWDPANLPSWCDDLMNSQNTINDDINANIINYKNYSTGQIKEEIDNGSLLRIWVTWANHWMDEWNAIVWAEWGSFRLEDILNDSYVWVFGALYGSLLNAWADLQISTSKNSAYVSLLNAALSLFHMLAINIPLIVMLIVFMIRIFVLWLAIILSPIIVLLKVFGFEDKIDKLDVDFLKYIKVGNLVWIIFSPAIICFAISISTVLVRLISIQNWEVVINTPILWWLITLNVAWVGVKLWKLIISILWIAITRFLMWAAVKSSAIWKSKFITSLKEMTESALWAMPLIPVPWKEGKGVQFMWVSSVFGWNGRDWIISKMSSNIKSKYDTESTNALNTLLMGSDEAAKQAQKKAEEYALTSYMNELRRTTNISSDWKTSISANTLDSDNQSVTTNYTKLSDAGKQQVIEEINKISDTERRKSFFNINEELTIGDKTYNFDKKENKWVIKKDK